jgi:hypothetical protein
MLGWLSPSISAVRASRYLGLHVEDEDEAIEAVDLLELLFKHGRGEVPCYR